MPERSPRRRSLLLGLLVLYFIVSAVLVAFEFASLVDRFWAHTDFSPFYRAAQFATQSYRASLYDISVRGALPLPVGLANGNYFNPPLLAVAVYGPLTLFDYDTARIAFIGVMAISSLGIVGLVYAWCRKWTPTLLAFLAIGSYLPLYDTFRTGQASALFALLVAGALIGMQTGRWAASGVLVSLLALKPSIALAPLGLVAWLGKPRAIVAAGLGLVVFVVLPFELLGPHALTDYASLLGRSRDDAFTLQGNITAGAIYMFNWNGFVARAFLVAPRPLIVFPLYAVTILLMFRVWLRGDLVSSWFAAMLATVLAVPHSGGHDWVLLLPIAIIYGVRSPTVPIIGALTLLHFLVNVSDLWFVESDVLSRILIIATPAAFLMLAHLAFEPEVQALAARFGRRREEAPSLAVP